MAAPKRPEAATFAVARHGTETTADAGLSVWGAQGRIQGLCLTIRCDKIPLLGVAPE
jgi:hypothetical protein